MGKAGNIALVYIYVTEKSEVGKAGNIALVYVTKKFEVGKAGNIALVYSRPFPPQTSL